MDGALRAFTLQASDRRCFVIATSDNGAAAVGVPLAQCLPRLAGPGIKLVFVIVHAAHVSSRLERGDVGLLFGSESMLPPTMWARKLFDEHLVMVQRKPWRMADSVCVQFEEPDGQWLPCSPAGKLPVTMKTWVALLRGINVGGRNRLPMTDLVAALEGIGARNVRTYIQSGNAVFQCGAKDHTRLARKLATGIGKTHGFEPHVLILGLDAVTSAMQNNPFPEAEADPKSLHLGFLTSVPTHPDLDKLQNLATNSERFRLIGSVFYLYAPDGVGRSKLAATAEKCLGVPMTDRNWKTVGRILELAGG